MKSLFDYVRAAARVRKGDQAVIGGVTHSVVSVTPKHVSLLHPDNTIVQYDKKKFAKFRVKK